MAAPRSSHPRPVAHRFSAVLRADVGLLALLAIGTLLMFGMAARRSAAAQRQATALAPHRTAVAAAATRKPIRSTPRPHPTVTLQRIKPTEAAPTPPPTLPLTEDDPQVVTVAAVETFVPPTPVEATTSVIEPWAQVWSDGNLRNAPSLDASVLGALHAGDQVRLAAWAGDWWWAHTPAGDGWISASLLIIDPEAIGHVPFAVAAVPDFAAVVVHNGGNLRDGPADDANVIGGVDAGDVLLLVGQAGAWWQVRTAAGSAWLHASLATLDPRGTQRVPRPTAPPAPVVPQAAPQTNVVIAAQAPQAPTPTQVVPMRQASRASATASPYQPKPTTVPLVAPTQGAPYRRVVPPTLQPPVITPTRAPATPRWPVADGPGNLIRLVGVDAPHAYLAPAAVGPFNRARTRILQGSGIDYLSVLYEAYRPITYVTTKPGVAARSWHKAGRAIDVAQYFGVGGRQGVVFVRDAQRPGLWRVLLRTARQDGTRGMWYGTKTLGKRAAYYVDVTTIMEAEGWQRVPGYQGVSEAWHYEYHGGVTWRTAMLQLYPKRTMNAFFP